MIIPYTDCPPATHFLSSGGPRIPYFQVILGLHLPKVHSWPLCTCPKLGGDTAARVETVGERHVYFSEASFSPSKLDTSIPVYCLPLTQTSNLSSLRTGTLSYYCTLESDTFTKCIQQIFIKCPIYARPKEIMNKNKQHSLSSKS